jgi:hypothetical protein
MERGTVPSLRSKGLRRASFLFVASAVTMLAAACGSSSGSGGSATSGDAGNGTGGGQNQALTAYVDCMKQNGVTLTLPSFGPGQGGQGGPGGGVRPSGQPRPSGSFAGRGPGAGGFFQKPAGVDDATWQKAQSACASVMPSRGPGAGGGGANQAYLNCLQQHGVTTTNGSRPSTTDPTVQKAMQTCKVLQPQASATPSS